MIRHKIQEDSVNHGKYGRHLTPLEQEAWNEYDLLLRKYKVNHYDRLSVHNAFPDINAAWEKVQGLCTYYALKGGVQEKDYL